jgi:hypothetical protein
MLLLQQHTTAIIVIISTWLEAFCLHYMLQLGLRRVAAAAAASSSSVDFLLLITCTEGWRSTLPLSGFIPN